MKFMQNAMEKKRLESETMLRELEQELEKGSADGDSMDTSDESSDNDSMADGDGDSDEEARGIRELRAMAKKPASKKSGDEKASKPEHPVLSL